MDLKLLYSALNSDYGVAVATNDPHRLRQQLYAIRRKADDPQLVALALVVPAEDGFLWIVKRSPTDGQN